MHIASLYIIANAFNTLHTACIKRNEFISIYWCVAYLPSEASIIEH
jgi:hypothetical protein